MKKRLFFNRRLSPDEGLCERFGGMPAIILCVFLQRLLVQGLTAGAVKE